MAIIDALIQQWQQQSLIEVFAVVGAVAYVWLAANESIWCWPSGFISTALYAYVYFDVTLVFQMLLNIYYMAMAIWGFIAWRQHGQDTLQISSMSVREHLVMILLGFSFTVVSYYIATLWFDYELLLIDIMVTVFSLLTTYLTVTKRLQSWLYWSVINAVTIYLLLATGLYLSIVLMIIYLVLAAKGYWQWRQNYNNRQQAIL